MDYEILKKLLEEYQDLFHEEYIVYDKFNFGEELSACIINKKKQKKQKLPSEDEMRELKKKYKEKFGKDCDYDGTFKRSVFYCKYYILNELRKN